MTEFQLGQTLYAPTKTGNVKTWTAAVYGDPNGPEATIEITTQTKLDGKKVTRHDVITKGKNIGKSNETTPYEQAISEAESRYRKKIDQGYKIEIPEDTSKANHNALGYPKPMLAHLIDKVKNIEFPAYFQPKLDGHRCIATRQDNKIVMYSKQGKLITTMDHIANYLEQTLPEGHFVDGELYLHGEALQNIGSLIKRKQEASRQIYYHVYDLILDKPYHMRIKHLVRMFTNPHASVLVVPTHLVDNMEQAQALTEQAIAQGYEGGILRTPDKGYLAGFRSRSLLKIKKFNDSEHTIVDVIEGKDRIVNDVELKVAIFICETPKGKRFECTAFGDMHEKDKIWHEREKFVGKTLTVKHSGYTKDGIPWHPVSLRLREDI